jgi:hypothetical protein
MWLGLNARPTAKVVKELLNEFREVEYPIIIRGKFAAGFISDVITRFCTGFDHVRVNGRRLRSSVQIGKSNYMHLVLEDAVIEDELIQFILRRAKRA